MDQLLDASAQRCELLRRHERELAGFHDSLAARRAEAVIGHARIDARREPEGPRIAVDLPESVPQRLKGGRDVNRQQVEVQLVGVPRRQPERDVGSMSADQDRDPRPLDSGRVVGHLPDSRVVTLEGDRRAAGHEQPPDDLEMLGKHGQTGREGRVVEPEGVGLDLPESGSEAERQSTSTDHVERAGDFGRQSGVPERGVDDHEADPNSRDGRCHGGGKRHAVERNARSVPFGEHVLAEPEGLEPQPLGEHGQLERPPPGLLGIPPVVFVEIALGQDQPDLHPASCRRR